MPSDDEKLREAKISLGAKPIQTTPIYNTKAILNSFYINRNFNNVDIFIVTR